MPYHYHSANEEAIYILEGKGTLRMDGEEIGISKGDYITCPAGSGAHQIINSSDNILRYLCFSTMLEPDVIVYPDSNKIGIFVGSAPGGPKEKRTVHKYLRGDAEVDYWDVEE
ncbi:MAG: cupin domain-containing protein [Candidatus Dadabacteria bacterium CSP1-2]|nr:MAG: cupin domain-containing protein [Candidatus Dadabacteria bacterium CSP1-2]